MRTKYKRRTILIFALSLCLGAFVKGQSEKTDSVASPLRHVAYGVQPAWAVTGAVSEVSGISLQKSFSPNLGNTLYGRLPGLTVLQGSSEPGLQDPVLRIRGLNTFQSGTNVLVVVDGIETTYSQLVPEEVESVTVLKDALATAMFGSKGANGVLWVTTKRGHAGPLKVSFSTQQGFTQATALPKFLGSYDFARLYNEALVNDGLPEKYAQADLDAYQSGGDPYFHPDVNWYDQVLRKSAPTSNYDLNFSGGSETVQFFVLMNMVNAQGLYRKTADLSDFSVDSKYRRLNFRSNVDLKLSKNLSASLTLGGTVADKSNPVDNTTSSMFSLLGLIPPNAFPVNNPNNTLSSNLLYSNPWGDILNTGFYTSNGRNFQTTLKLSEKLDFITEGLSVSALISFNNNFISLSNKSRTYLRYGITNLGDTAVQYTPISQNSALSSSEGESDQWRSYTIQSMLNYSRAFGNTTVDGILLGSSSNYAYTNGGIPRRDVGYYGRLSLTNSKKYIGEVSFGYNASDGFPKGSRYGLFPAVSAGWVVSNEGFMKNNGAISFLKIRGSYGLTGNDEIGASRRYMWLSDFISSGSYRYGTTNSTSIGGIVEGMHADSSITWEKQKQYNFGLEATLFNRIDVSFDIFSQDRYDIVASPYRTLPQFVGVSNVGLGTAFPQSNVGKTNNKGFEASIGFRSNEASDFRYFVNADLWYAKNKVVYNAEALQLFDYLYRSGRPVNQPFMLEAIGFFADEADIINSPKQNYENVVRPGDIKYKDQNGDNIIDQNDYYPVDKPSLPTFSGSLSAGMTYRGFDLEILLQGATGNSVFVGGSYYYAFQNNGKISEAALGRWTPETASSATYPRLSSANNLNNYRTSSFWMKDGSYLKLRSIELGYSLPQSVISKVKVSGARVFLNGTNVLSLDKMDFTDPETLYGYPSVRSFSCGVRVTL